MSTVAPTEELVEDLGVGLLRSLGVPSRSGQQVGEAGERAGVTACLLHGRFAAAVQRHNSHLPAPTANAVAASLSRPLLAMYGYPPDLSEDATQLVLKQAELSTEYAK